jgi:hypothetical protein
MHLLELTVASLAGLAVVAFLVGRYPIHRTLHWRGDVAGNGRDIAPTWGGQDSGSAAEGQAAAGE